MTEPHFSIINPNISEISDSIFYIDLYPMALSLKSNITCNLKIKRKDSQQIFNNQLNDLELIKYFAPIN